jgi:NAD(P)-dependent dehydrogenase (short-subunit alcohol dehydrogenase family)
MSNGEMPERTTDMSGKVVLVTGATSGIGEATATRLAALGATVLAVGRTAPRGRAAVERIRASSATAAVRMLVADLAKQDDVRALAGEVNGSIGRLDVVINNAGVDVGARSVTPDGLELTFAVNYLAPFLLTSLLVDLLKASAPSRIINVASSAYRGGEIDFDDLQNERRFGQRAYNNSKLALVLFTYELARRLDGTGVTANCVDPGFVRTSLGSTLAPGYRLLGALMWPFMATPEEAARTTVFAASSPDLTEVTGAYLKRQRRVDTNKKTHDRTTSERLWQVSEVLVAGTAPR